MCGRQVPTLQSEASARLSDPASSSADHSPVRDGEGHLRDADDHFHAMDEETLRRRRRFSTE